MENDYLKQNENLEKFIKENEELKEDKKNILLKINKLLGHSEDVDILNNGLDELEKHFQAVGLTVLKQQQELSELRRYKLIAHRVSYHKKKILHHVAVVVVVVVNKKIFNYIII